MHYHAALTIKHQQLRRKQQLIEDNLPKLAPEVNVISEFETYRAAKRQKAFEQLCTEENIVPSQLEKLLQTYVFANRFPLDQEIVESLSGWVKKY